MNYLLEIILFNVVIFTICGINMAKKGKLTKKATIGKLGFFSDTYFCGLHWRTVSVVHIRSLKDGFTDILCG